jgi:hypothetical protein
MATNTTKLGLIKPDFTDVVDVTDLNNNMDILDDALTDSSTLDDLSGVTFTSAASGDALVYNGTGWVNQPRAGRNLLYNGAMQVHQRGTSATGITGTGLNTADRWWKLIDSLGTWTETIENDAPTGSGFRKSLKLLCTTANSTPANSARFVFAQKLEGLDLQGLKKGTTEAQSLTISFWTKSNVTGTFILSLRDVDNSRDISASYTVASADTWERKTVTFAGDTTGVFDNDSNESLQLIFWLGAGTNFTSGTLVTSWASSTAANRAVGQTNLAAATNNYWQITGVQLEVGPVATPFEFKPFGQELAECQRYYYRIGDPVVGGASFTHYGDLRIDSATTAAAAVDNPVPMRTVAGSIEFLNMLSSDSSNANIAVTNATINTGQSTIYHTRLNLTFAGGATSGRMGWLLRNGGAASFFAASSEL